MADFLRAVQKSKVHWRKPKGRPRVWWLNGMKSAVSERDICFKEAEALSTDHKGWWKFVKIHLNILTPLLAISFKFSYITKLRFWKQYIPFRPEDWYIQV